MVSVHMFVLVYVCVYVCEMLFKEPPTVEWFMASYPLFSPSLSMSHILTLELELENALYCQDLLFGNQIYQILFPN